MPLPAHELDPANNLGFVEDDADPVGTPRAAVLLAAVAPLPSLLALASVYGLRPSLLWHLALWLPLLGVRTKAFPGLCLGCAAPLLLLTVLLNIYGGYAFLPGALLLVLAAAVASSSTSKRRSACAACGAFVAVLGIGGWGLLAVQALSGPADAFIVEVRDYETFAAQSPDPRMGDGSGIGPGATDVSEGSGGLMVFFRDDLDADGREELRERLRALRGVGEVRLCRPLLREC